MERLIRLAASDADIEACGAVMRELRPHIEAADFLGRVRYQQQHGYHLAMLTRGDMVLAVAGFRFLENLAWGKQLYVDDLVTARTARSGGHGAALLSWLRSHARTHGCHMLHLDSGVQRHDAHRFYEREGMTRASYHFSAYL